jgi:hypothetical protein
VILTETQAKNTIFTATPNDADATIEYAYTATDANPTLLFSGTWTNKTLVNNSYVWAKVTAEDSTTTLIYKIKVTVTDSGSEPPANPGGIKHQILKHSHDKNFGGKDGLTEYGEDVVVEFEGDFSDAGMSIKFNNEDYNLSAYKDDVTARIITETKGDAVGKVTKNSAVVTLPAVFTDRFENGTHEIQVWFSDSTVKAEAGVATIVVNREDGFEGEDGDPIPPLGILDPEDPEGSHTPTDSQDQTNPQNPTDSQNPTVPQTSDETINPLMLIAIITVSFVALLTLITVALKRRRLDE